MKVTVETDCTYVTNSLQSWLVRARHGLHPREQVGMSTGSCLDFPQWWTVPWMPDINSSCLPSIAFCWGVLTQQEKWNWDPIFISVSPPVLSAVGCCSLNAKYSPTASWVSTPSLRLLALFEDVPSRVCLSPLRCTDSERTRPCLLQRAVLALLSVHCHHPR